MNDYRKPELCFSIGIFSVKIKHRTGREWAAHLHYAIGNLNVSNCKAM